MSFQLQTQPHIYDIQETLGESPLSIVYLAYRFNKNIEFKQPVVIKIFKQTQTLLPKLQMESLLRVQHQSHLVKVLAFEQFESQPAIILEYISGLSLKQLVQSTSLSEEEVQYICAQISHGLQQLQEKGLCHGDLSLSNILINTQAQVFLTDYGLANYGDFNLYSTQPFNAPELTQNMTATFQSDLFSLGVLEKVLLGRFSEKELNAMNNNHFISNEHPLLHQYPQNRKPTNFLYSHQIQNILSKKVYQTRFVQRCFNNSLIRFPLFLKQKKALFSGVYLASLLVVFLTFLFSTNPFISYSKDLPQLATVPSKVLIRTTKWLHIQLADSKGYSPIEVPIKQAGTYKITWKKQGSNGIKILTIQPGQTLLLKDKDFK